MTTPQESDAWQNLGASVGKLLSDTLAVSITPTDATPARDAEAISMFVRLIDVRHALEFDLVLDSPRAVATALATAMVGEPVEDTETLCEVLGELVNIVGGGLKVCFEADFALTLGLPRRRDEAMPTYFCQKTISLSTDDGIFAVSLGVHGRPVTKHAPVSLREGMVLAQDVVSQGVTLFPSGFRLTSNSIDRLQTLGHRELSVVEL